jgi:hypothetical protein
VSLEEAYLSEEAAVTAAIKEHETFGHPGFDHDAVSQMMNEKPGKDRYPRPRFLEFDRVRGDGEILHPYAARRDAHGKWEIRLYTAVHKRMAGNERGGIQHSSAFDSRCRDSTGKTS